jgi:hypothetical protein
MTNYAISLPARNESSRFQILEALCQESSLAMPSAGIESGTDASKSKIQQDLVPALCRQHFCWFHTHGWR